MAAIDLYTIKWLQQPQVSLHMNSKQYVDRLIRFHCLCGWNLVKITTGRGFFSYQRWTEGETHMEKK